MPASADVPLRCMPRTTTACLSFLLSGMARWQTIVRIPITPTSYLETILIGISLATIKAYILMPSPRDFLLP